MRTLNEKRLFSALLISWFLINLIQSVFTELLWDEAYYKIYSDNLAWGYFDHPPMIALLVKISSLFFGGNLGTRFMTIVLQIGTLILTWELVGAGRTGKSAIIYFFIVGASLTMFSAYGFITTPDAPLLFFTSLFLYGYKRFLLSAGWKEVLIISLSIAGLVYSKYQSIIVVGLVILSNPCILRSRRFLIAGIGSVILLIPHIIWQINNDFPTMTYQLIDRSEGFRWKYFLEYIPNQLAVFNPFIFGAVIYILIRHQVADLFNRALHLLIIGFIVLFWISSFRGHVEPHWTIACSVPMIVLIISRYAEDKRLAKYVRCVIAPSLVLIFFVRIALVTDLPLIKKVGFNGKKEKIEFIESVTGDHTVVFLSSFQYPAMFSFFTGKTAFPLSTLFNRKTQYDILQMEKDYQNKPAFILFLKGSGSPSYKKDGFAFYGFRTDSLQTTNRLKISWDLPEEEVVFGDSMKIAINISNRGAYDVDFNHSCFPVQVCAAFIKGRETYIQKGILSVPVNMLPKNQSVERIFRFSIPDVTPGIYQMGITLETKLGPAINSIFFKIKVEDDD